MKKLIVTLFILVLSMSFVFADTTIVDETITSSKSFILDGLPYKFILMNSNDGYVESKFGNWLVHADECHDRDLFVFCNTVLEDTLRGENQIQLKIIQKSNIKKPLGGYCSEDSQCFSSNCFHETCVLYSPVCGDGYCDGKESCNEDCVNQLKIIEFDPYTISIYANKSWIDSNLVTEPNSTYTFIVTGNIKLAYRGLDIKPEGTNKIRLHNSPCNQHPTGALIADLCGDCYLIGSEKTIEVNKKCNLKFRINDDKLIDNSGYFNVEIHKSKTTKMPYLTDNEIKNIFDKYISSINTGDYENVISNSKGFVKDYYVMKDNFKNNIKKLNSSYLPLFYNDVKVIKYDISRNYDNYIVYADITSSHLGNKINFTIKYDDDFYIANANTDKFIFNENTIKNGEITFTDLYNDVLKEYKAQELIESEKAKIEAKTRIKEEKLNKFVSLILKVIFWILGILWIWSLIDCINSDIDNRDGYIVAILLLTIIGSLIYYFKFKHNKVFSKLNTFIYKNRVKQEEMKELKSKYKEAIQSAKDDYVNNPSKQQQEIEGIEQEYSESKDKLEKIIDSINNNKAIKKHTSKKRIVKEKIVKATGDNVKKIKGNSYVDFKNHFEPISSNCLTIPNYVKVYMAEYKSDKELKLLSQFIADKLNTDNYSMVYSTVKKEYNNLKSQSGFNPLTEMKEIDDMSGYEFEDYLDELFNKLGYESVATKKSRDGGVDLILIKGDEKILIQAKKYGVTQTVGVGAVRDVQAREKMEGATKLIVLTTALKFSSDARKEASQLGVELWNRNKLKELLRKANLLEKW